MSKAFFLSVLLALEVSLSSAAETAIQLLSGSDSTATVDWEFKVSGGRRAGEWSRIPVPSNWEMQGFGTYRYHCDWLKNPAPDHTGWYRYRFSVPQAWHGRAVRIVFGGSMTDTEVRINGRLAGPAHQGGFYQFGYDVSPLLHYGRENLLEVTVRKFSEDRSVNQAERQADYWLFGGIYRPVWLEARPSQHIERVAIDAKHTGEFTVEVFLGGITQAASLQAQVEELEGAVVGESERATAQPGLARVRLKGKVSGIKPWSAETPHRYRMRIQMVPTEGEAHRVFETCGFRTVELRRRDGFYVNGEKVMLKGANRHSFWPTTGRATSQELSVKDVLLMKEMNMNAVRSSHYPPDPHFLAAADEHGLYVIDELAGWQKPYSTEAGAKLVPLLVQRDVNHPAIVAWANGNEGGNNHALVPLYAEHDPQRRPVIHPWNNFNGLNTAHYEIFDGATGWLFHGRDVFMPTEFLHGNYDGGHGAGLDDWWNLMIRHPLCAGGFLWAFADEGIVRGDRGGEIDTANDSAPDGIVGPYREKEGSFFTIKKVWSPVYIEEGQLETLASTWDGRLRVHNRYDFTNLQDIEFRWELVQFPGPTGEGGASQRAPSGTVARQTIPPRSSAWMKLDLPTDWHAYDGLRLRATDPHGREIYVWSWMMRSPAEVAARIPVAEKGRVAVLRTAEAIALSAKDIEASIDLATGELAGVRRRGVVFSLKHGPRLIGAPSKLKRLTDRPDGDAHIVEAEYEGELRRVRWRLEANGWLRLDYSYRLAPHLERDCLGVSFDYPEANVAGVRWLGRGPYRVWKNRLKGVEYDVWEKNYNDTLTGAGWEYPEFKGFHANVYWLKLTTKEGPITVLASTEDLFVRLFTPRQPAIQGPEKRFTRVDFPPGDLSFLHGIAPLGNRFHPADAHGPAGHPNTVPRNGGWYEGTLHWYFGE